MTRVAPRISRLSTSGIMISAGIILVAGSRVLILQGAMTGVWSFPKGHPELVDNGSALMTAVREAYEETGYVPGVDYTLGEQRRLGKRKYWVSYPIRGLAVPKLDPIEHRAWRWATVDEIQWLNVNSDVDKWARSKRF